MTKENSVFYGIWKCPACGYSQAEEFEECPACGLVVSKFRKEGEQEQKAGYRDDHTLYASRSSSDYEDDDGDDDSEDVSEAASETGSEGIITGILGWISETASSISERISQSASDISQSISDSTLRVRGICRKRLCC